MLSENNIKILQSFLDTGSLDKTGNQFGLTRETIRQVLQRCFNRFLHPKYLTFADLGIDEKKIKDLRLEFLGAYSECGHISDISKKTFNMKPILIKYIECHSPYLRISHLKHQLFELFNEHSPTNTEDEQIFNILAKNVNADKNSLQKQIDGLGEAVDSLNRKISKMKPGDITQKC